MLLDFILLCYADIIYIFLQTEGLWQPCIQQVYEFLFPTTFAHLLSLCHILFILAILCFRLFRFHYIAVVICEQWSLRLLLYCFGLHEPWLYKMVNCLLRHKDTKIGTINNSIMASECSNERGNGTFLSLKQSQK